MSDLPFDNRSTKAKKAFNEHLSKKTNEFQALNTFPTSSLWGTLYDALDPLSNTGEKSALQTEAEQKLGNFYKDYPIPETVTLLTEDGPKPVLVLRPAANECAVIDWLHVTIHKETFKSVVDARRTFDDPSNSDYVYAFSAVLKDILGFGVECRLRAGKNYYEESYALENDCGMISIGGQNDTVMLCITGQGCLQAKYGWQQDLHAWLSLYAKRPKITRIDYAFDDLDGSIVSPDWANAQDDLEGFQCGGRPPCFQTAGNWKRPDGSGRTAYIGKRSSSKYCRIYEKGMQLGDKNSRWTRVEVEYKSKDYHIPLDALLNVSEHFLAAYPCFHIFDPKKNPIKFETLAKKAEILWDKAVEITKHQFSKYLKAFRDFYSDDSKLLDMLMPDPDSKNQYPKRLKLLTVDYTDSMPPMLPA